MQHSRTMMSFVVLTVLFTCCLVTANSSRISYSKSEGDDVNKAATHHNYEILKNIFHRTGGYLGTPTDIHRYAGINSKSDKDDLKPSVPKTPRGFADFISGDDDTYDASPDEQNTRWSPYYSPNLRDSIYDSGSNTDWNVWKRDDEKPMQKFSPEYADMLMMMHAMKKMDSNGGSRPGLLNRILDNPATLVMATFIPLSLILAAALPLIVNVMMNGITIPAVITTASKGRLFKESNSSDTLAPILQGLADFGSKYIENPDCFQKIFCEMSQDNFATENYGGKYIKQAANAATFIVNEDLLNSFGIKPLVDAIKSGQCDQVSCSKRNKIINPDVSNVLNDALYDHNMKNRPKIR